MPDGAGVRRRWIQVRVKSLWRHLCHSSSPICLKYYMPVVDYVKSWTAPLSAASAFLWRYINHLLIIPRTVPYALHGSTTNRKFHETHQGLNTDRTTDNSEVSPLGNMLLLSQTFTTPCNYETGLFSNSSIPNFFKYHFHYSYLGKLPEQN